jgi:hypothetical protein
MIALNDAEGRGHLVDLLVRGGALPDLHPADQPGTLQARERHVHLCPELTTSPTGPNADVRRWRS